MRAILTKYHSPTDRRGARITASAGDGATVTVSYDYAASDAHDRAALALCNKMQWTGDLIKGGIEDRNGRSVGNVYLFARSERISNPTKERKQ